MGLAIGSVRFAKGTADFLSEDEPEDGVGVVEAMEEGLDFFGDGREVVGGV